MYLLHSRPSAKTGKEPEDKPVVSAKAEKEAKAEKDPYPVDAKAENVEGNATKIFQPYEAKAAKAESTKAAKVVYEEPHEIPKWLEQMSSFGGGVRGGGGEFDCSLMYWPTLILDFFIFPDHLFFYSFIFQNLRWKTR